jgi:hypothetical protein
MRNFDLDQDLSFEVCGEMFKMRLVKPEVLATLQDSEPPDSNMKALDVMDAQIEAFLDNANGQVERYRAMRKREDNSPSQGQLQDILTWMIEVQTARPTMLPSPSPRGRGASAATSPVG